jgi:hypothetical protein
MNDKAKGLGLVILYFIAIIIFIFVYLVETGVIDILEFFPYSVYWDCYTPGQPVRNLHYFKEGGQFLNYDFVILGQQFTITWYWITAIVIVVISTLSSIHHKKFGPAVWGWLLGFTLYMTHPYSEPVLFGWMGLINGNIYLFALSLGLAIAWYVQVTILLYNGADDGEVWT